MQSAQLPAGKHLHHIAAAAFHLIAAVIWYLFITWPWEEFEKPLALASAVLVTLFLTSLFIWWTIFGEPKSPTEGEGY
jgi:hypothetical protein